MTAVLEISGGTLAFGETPLWSGLDLRVEPGEFLAVLGANGSVKTSLLKVILGQQQLDAGTIVLDGEPARQGDRRIGYIPQQRIVPAGPPRRGRDLVTLCVDGHKWGLPLPSRATKARVDELIDAVGATGFASRPIGSLSGGEQQRLRVGQALAADPMLLLCDEPLSSLDLAHQRGVAELIEGRRRDRGSSVIFVTQEINPVLGMVDRILYLAHGGFTIGTPDEVLRADVLSRLYGTPVEVFRSGGRVFVAGIPDGAHHHEGDAA